MLLKFYRNQRSTFAKFLGPKREVWLEKKVKKTAKRKPINNTIIKFLL